MGQRGYLTQLRPKHFHPGPLGLPIFGYMLFLVPNPCIKVGKIGEMYGNIFSLKMGSYWLIVLNDFESIKNALKQDVFSGRPNHLLGMKFFLKEIGYNEGHVWQVQRKFTLISLRDFGFGKISMEASIQQDVHILVSYLRSKTNTPMRLIDTFAVSAVNSLWRILSNEVCDLDDPTMIKVHNAIKEGLSNPDHQGPLYFMPWISKKNSNQSGLNSMKSAVDTLRKLLFIAIDKHRQKFISGSTPNDFIDIYLQEIEDTTDPESSFYKEEGIANMVDTLMNLFIANSDTISTSLDFGILYLATCRNVLVKLQKEIDYVIGRERLPNISDLEK